MLVFMRPVAGKVGVDLPAASWYNIFKAVYRGDKQHGDFAPSALRTDSILKASQKCPCKQAFLLHGIIGHGITLVCNRMFTYRVREFSAMR